MALKEFAFKLLNKDGYAREGIIKTHRGIIRTPAFYASWNSGNCKSLYD